MPSHTKIVSRHDKVETYPFFCYKNARTLHNQTSLSVQDVLQTSGELLVVSWYSGSFQFYPYWQNIKNCEIKLTEKKLTEIKELHMELQLRYDWHRHKSGQSRCPQLWWKPVPGDIQGQAAPGSEQPGRVVDVPIHYSGAGLEDI